MENSDEKKLWERLAYTIVIGLIILFAWGGIREYRFSNNHRFTIATTTGYGNGGWVNFEFTVKGVVYKRSDKGLSLKSNGAKYFVKYYALDPSVLAKVVSNDKVPDCIGEPPADGWAEIPQCK